ncbi:MAG: BT_3928 family protein [Ferruginibacter sp.]
MKTVVNIARIIVGGLFVFSGLIKAIDPLGLAYKMQEFFEAWANSGFLKKLMFSLNDHALTFSIAMITLEVAVGVALIVGWQRKIMTRVLLLLILFFTFLTAYVLFSGKIRACGCFGDCIPLTPVQTFSKDIVLLLLSLVLVFNWKLIRPLAKPYIAGSIVMASVLATLFLQSYVQKHLPVKDCLPFKPGNDILELRKMPKDAVPDKYDYVFVYEKKGERKEFKVNALPDSSWKYADRKQILVEKGKNNVPLINDFSFTTSSGNDTTEAILNQSGSYYLLFIQNLDKYPPNWQEDLEFVRKVMSRGVKIYIITSQRKETEERFSDVGGMKKTGVPVFTCDFTAIKTAARANPTLYLMKGPVIEKKWGWADFDKVKLVY